MKPEIAAGLLAAWNRKLYLWFSQYNEEYAGGRLRRPLITLASGCRQLGSWDPAMRRITISVEHVRRDPWLDVMDTLRHEMAHQYAQEVLDADEPPHGPAFRRACEILRCSPRASSVPTGERPAGEKDERIVRVLKKILSLATSPNEHEAQAAVNKARRMLLEYNVDLVAVDRDRNFDCMAVGEVKGRRSTWELWVAAILNQFFFVEVLWARTYHPQRDRMGTVLQLFGTPTNLSMASYVHDYLGTLLPRLWEQYRRDNGLTGNRERMRFYAGVAQGFHDKLAREAEAAANAWRPGGSNDLVWKGDSRLQAYYRHLNPYVQTRTTSGVSASEAFRDGLREGRKVDIRRPLTAGPGFGGLLGPG